MRTLCYTAAVAALLAACGGEEEAPPPPAGAAKPGARAAAIAAAADSAKAGKDSAAKPGAKADAKTATAPAKADAKAAAPATADAKAAAAPAKADAKAAPAPDSARVEAASATILRETYRYRGTTRRDPFESLAQQQGLGPMLSDVRLVGIAYDELGRNTVAVLRNIATREIYRVRRGEQLGRATVRAISPKEVTFMVDDFGSMRQEVLSLRDTTRTGKE
jgi:hypothetical protein